MNHDLKIEPWAFADVKSGKKRFELRVDDRGYQVGDKFTMYEFNRDKQTYTGNAVKGEILYLLKNERWLQPNVCAWQFRADSFHGDEWPMEISAAKEKP